MERWILVCGVVVIFLGLAVMGWHYQAHDDNARICSDPGADCGERRL
jgi:hypothetical protein